MSSHPKAVTLRKRSSFREAMRRSRASWTRWRLKRRMRRLEDLRLLLSPVVDRLAVMQLQQEEWQEKLETLLELLVNKHLESSQESQDLLMEVLQTLQPSPEEQIVRLLGASTPLPSSPSSVS